MASFLDSKGDVIRDVYKFHVIITTFEMVIADAAVLRAIPWTACIVDEAHRCVSGDWFCTWGVVLAARI